MPLHIENILKNLLKMRNLLKQNKLGMWSMKFQYPWNFRKGIMKKLSLKANCLCGGIQLKTNGYHRNIQNCHCIQCMKTHGHYAAYTNVEEQNIKFIKKKNIKMV